MRIFQTIRVLMLAAGVTLSASCTSTTTTLPPSVNKVARTMDELASKEAEFGTMGISSPLLSKPDARYSFNLSKTADDFFNDAKTSRQGAAYEFQQTAASAGLGLNSTVNPVAAAAYLAQLQQYQQGVAQNNSAQAFENRREAMINGSAYDQYQVSLQSATTMPSPQREQAIALARSQLANSLVGPSPTTLPSFPTAATQPSAPTNLVTRPTDLLNSFAANGALAGFQGLATTRPALGLDDQSALLTAAANNTTKAIFTLVGDPSAATQFSDKVVLFGVCTVSVNPGWRTRRHYSADVATKVSYILQPAREDVLREFVGDSRIPMDLRRQLAADNLIPPPDDGDIKTPSGGHPSQPLIPARFAPPEGIEVGQPFGGPLIAVASPFTDTQTLDLEGSFRNQQDLALSIAAQMLAAGATNQAQTFFKYAHQMQQDFSTISANVVISSYAIGPLFGFHVGPRYKAIAQMEAGNASGPADILDRQSFPSLVVFGMDQSDLLPRVVRKDNALRLYEVCLSTQGVNQWVLSDHSLLRSLLALEPTVRERDKLQSSYNLDVDSDTASKELKKDNNHNPTRMMMNARIDALREESFGPGAVSYFPKEVFQTDPTVVGIAPNSVMAGIDSSLLITGQSLDRVDLGQIKAAYGNTVVHTPSDTDQSLRPRLTNGVISLTLKPPNDASGPIVLQLTTSAGRKIYSPPVNVYPTTLPSPTLVVPDTFSLDKDANGKATAKTAKMFLIGERLDQIDLQHITVAQGPAKMENPAMIGSVITLDITVTDVGIPIALTLPLKSNQGQSLLSPPVVGVWTAAPQAALPTPHIELVSPTEIDLAKGSDGKFVATTQPVIFAGEHLDQIDTSKIAVVSGPATVIAAKPVSGAIEVDINITDVGKIFLSLPPANSAGQTILSPPIEPKSR